MKKLVESQFFVGNREGECGGTGKWIVGMADKVVDGGPKVVGKHDEGTDIRLKLLLFISVYRLLGYPQIVRDLLLAYAPAYAQAAKVFNHFLFTPII